MKNNLPYFSHDNNARNHPKMKALIAEFGYEGYGRFWVLNERIAESTGAFIDISRKVNKLDLAKELGFDGNELDQFIAFLSDPEIDLINIQDNIITTDRLTELFDKTMESRVFERDRKKEKKESEEIQAEKGEFQPENEEIQAEKDTDKTRQDKTKQNKIKQNKIKQEFPKRIALLDREPKNDIERVNKKWLENYITLYGNQPINPRWDLSSSRVSNVLKQCGIEKTLKALDTAMKDKFCLESGYILQTIMSGNVISKLVNSPIKQKHGISTDNIPPEKVAGYFREE
jgi:hypothetical protein